MLQPECEQATFPAVTAQATSIIAAVSIGPPVLLDPGYVAARVSAGHFSHSVIAWATHLYNNYCSCLYCVAARVGSLHTATSQIRTPGPITEVS